MPSFGNFGTASVVQFFLGIPRSVGFPGVQMDIDRVIGSGVATDATPGAVIAFQRAVGIQGSALENLIPEQAFKNSSLAADDPLQTQAVSAVKAIAIAAAQGQRIYTLNASNQAIHAATVSQLGIDSDARQEITDALASGKEVMVHQSTISYAGFTGSGYIIVDPETGAGAYRVSGGLNGAWELFVAGLEGALPFISALLSLSKMLGLAAPLLDAWDTAQAMADALEHCAPPDGAWIAGLALMSFLVVFIGSWLLVASFTGVGAVALIGILGALVGALFGKMLDGLRRRYCWLR
jgi:cytochrome c5